MANRTFNQFGGTLERKVVKLFAKITYAGVVPVPTLVLSEVLNSGTSPITINPSQGFESLAVNSAGTFTLTLGANNGNVPTYDPYVRLLDVTAVQVAAAGASPLFGVQVTANNVNGASGNPSLQVSTLVWAGTAPAPLHLDNGSTLLVEITLSNTTAY
jgi:hypothetical protein